MLHRLTRGESVKLASLLLPLAWRSAASACAQTPAGSLSRRVTAHDA